MPFPLVAGLIGGARPYLFLAAGVALAASHVHMYRTGVQRGEDKVRAQVETRRSTANAAAAQAVARMANQADAAQQEIAKKIEAIDIEFQPTREVIRREIVEKPVYRSVDCRITPDVMRAINEAVTRSRSGPTATDRPDTASAARVSSSGATLG